jgi:hypothetical protein
MLKAMTELFNENGHAVVSGIVAPFRGGHSPLTTG